MRFNIKNKIIPFIFIILVPIITLQFIFTRKIKTNWLPSEIYIIRFHWVDSVNFYLKSGKILMYPPDQRLEDVALAEDQGYPLMLSYLSKIVGLKNVSFATFIKFNYIYFILLGIISSILISLSFNSLFLAIVFYYLYLKSGIYYGGVDHQWMLGAYIPFYLSFLILSVSKRKSFRPVLFGFYFFLTGVVNTIREGNGVVGILLFISLLVIIIIQKGLRKHLDNLPKKIILTVFFIFMYLIPQIVLTSIRNYRNKIYFNGASSVKITHHGLWHNAFMGLGFVPNKYNIRWDDANNLRFVKQVNPKADYVTDEYYQILKQLYFKYSLESPDLWFKNLFAKLREIHNLQGKFYVYNNLILTRIKNYLLYFSLIIMFISTKNNKTLRKIYWLNLAGLIISSIPALIAIPMMTYLHGLRASYFMTFFFTGAILYSKTFVKRIL